MARLFGTDGVRGIANEGLTPELAFRLGRAAGALLSRSHRGTMVVGKDTRISGDMLEASLVAGLTSAGCDVLLAGIVPTPAVALFVRELSADAGVVISASHNPAEYNGIKFFGPDGFKLPDDVELEMERIAEADAESRPTGAGVGRVNTVDDAVERYVAHAVATVPGRLDGMRIALDCGHGAASRTSRAAFESLGAEVVAINCDWNGTDINDHCGSTDLAPVTSLVLEARASLGFAHDGDADRVLAVDELGNEVDGDRIMAICANDLRSRGRLHGDVVVGTVMTNMGFEEAMDRIGVAVERAQVGDRWVLERMRQVGATLGGEQSGHVIFLEHTTTGDGLITALQLAHVVHETGRTLSELAGIMRRFPQVLLNVRVPDPAAVSASERLIAAVAEEEARLGSAGRVLVRASGTEPLVRVMVEASDERVAAETARRLADVVEAAV
jgi:phosphoglucosamine mutase